MALFTLNNDSLQVTISTQGGAIVRCIAKTPHGDLALLRDQINENKINQKINVLDCACFPLVPFGNRVQDNRFVYDGVSYQLQPNVEWEAHYLHGDGWLGEWNCVSVSDTSLVLSFNYANDIYQYTAYQHIELNQNQIELSLSVTQLGDVAMPFGLGWHPYFPLDTQTTLHACATDYFLEEANHIAGKKMGLPKHLDFNTAKPIPQQWINNGFDGWDGRAKINYAQYEINLSTNPPCPVYFIFVSDSAIDPNYHFNYFCFEPMTHQANDHQHSHHSHLVRLEKNQTLTQSMRLDFKLKGSHV